MNCSEAQRSYQGVPDGSRLEVWTEGDGDFVIQATVIGRNPDEDQLLTHEDLFRPNGGDQAGIFEPLHRVWNYTVRFEMRFLPDEDTEATINLRVVKPNGNIHSAPIRYTCTGNEGDGVRFDFREVQVR